jgi:hypothetical protein
VFEVRWRNKLWNYFVYVVNIHAWTWCLIHNAHLEKISSFCKILDLRKTH